MKVRTLKISIPGKGGDVSSILLTPEKPKAYLVFAHGAGAPMNHSFMNKAAEHLADERIGTLRYNFPYSEKKLKRIDSLQVLLQTVRTVVETAAEYTEGLPLFAGGKSMGGRMTSQAAAEKDITGVRGIIFFGFPLHPPGKESTERAEHLFKVNAPMLFLQGTRDKLANLELLRPIVSRLGDKATLYIIDGADHSFHMLKSSGKSDDETLREVSGEISQWIDIQI